MNQILRSGSPMNRTLVFSALIAAATMASPAMAERAPAAALVPARSLAGAFLAAETARAENDFDAAVKYYGDALSFDPDNPAILDSMGWVLFKLDRSEQALPYLERAAGADFNAEIVAHLIEVLWSLDRTEAASDWVERGAEAFADDPVFRATLDRLGLAP